MADTIAAQPGTDGPTSRHAIDGWFTEDGPDGRPALIGTRCRASGTVFFPPERGASRVPGHAGGEVEEVVLSNRGRLWSYTDARYQPPEPYVPVSDPHEPFCIAAVELSEERMVVLGQVVAGVDVEDLRVGMEMELVIDTLFVEDTDGAATDVRIWKWQPVTDAAGSGTANTEGGA